MLTLGCDRLPTNRTRILRFEPFDGTLFVEGVSAWHDGGPAFDVFHADGAVGHLGLPFLAHGEAFAHVDDVQLRTVKPVGLSVRQQNV